jgi:hypothetical protein
MHPQSSMLCIEDWVAPCWVAPCWVPPYYGWPLAGGVQRGCSNQSSMQSIEDWGLVVCFYGSAIN